MNYSDFLLPPSEIRAAYRRWVRRQQERATVDDAIKALWATDYWSKVAKVAATGRFDLSSTEGEEWIEVNRIWKYVMGYTSGLHDPGVKAKFLPSPDGKGDHEKVQALANQWVYKAQTALTIHDADEMSILHPGCAYLIGYDEENPDPADRVWLRAIPWREIVVDWDVGTRQGQRFVGHCYPMALREARRLFRDKTIKGQPRGDSTIPDPSKAAPDTLEAESIVWVLEVFNFVDPYYDGESSIIMGGKPIPEFEPPPLFDEAGNPTVDANNKPRTPPRKGRREFYLVSEGEGMNAPRIVLPLPYRLMNGRPAVSMIVQTYRYAPGLPLQGMSSAESVFDQFREYNIVRSKMATALRRDTVQFATYEGVLDPKAESVVRRGAYGSFVYLSQKHLENNKPIRELIDALPMPTLLHNHTLYAREIGSDIETNHIASPASQGVISGGSATEVKFAQDATQSELAVMRTIKNAILEEMLRTWVCVQRASLESAKDLAITQALPEPVIYADVNGKSVEVKLADLQADFRIEIEAGEPSELSEIRELRKFLEFLQAWIPLAKQVADGDTAAAVALDELVARAKMPEKFNAKAIQAMPKVGQDTEIPRGPGAGSALPGEGSAPAAVPDEPIDETAGGPQPNPEQPMDNQTGVAQNGTAGGV